MTAGGDGVGRGKDLGPFERPKVCHSKYFKFQKRIYRISFFFQVKILYNYF